MEDQELENIEIAPRAVVIQTARDFAAALAETPQFKAFEQATYAFRKDQSAQQAMAAFQKKQIELRAMIMLNALSPDQRTELEQLAHAFRNQAVVQEYFAAEAAFGQLCQRLGDTISQSIGLNYAAACGVSCCG